MNYILDQNNSGNGHLMFKLSTNQILATMKYQSIHAPESIIKAINEEDLFNNKIQTNHSDSNNFTLQDDHSDNYEDNC